MTEKVRTESEIIRACAYNATTRTWIWDSPEELDREGRMIVLLSAFLHFTKVEINGRTQEVVEVLEAPLKKYLKTLNPIAGDEFAGRYLPPLY